MPGAWCPDMWSKILLVDSSRQPRKLACEGRLFRGRAWLRTSEQRPSPRRGGREDSDPASPCQTGHSCPGALLVWVGAVRAVEPRGHGADALTGSPAHLCRQTPDGEELVPEASCVWFQVEAFVCRLLVLCELRESRGLPLTHSTWRGPSGEGFGIWCFLSEPFSSEIAPC